MYARHNVAHKNVAFGVTRAGSLVPVPVEPLDLGCKEKLRACRFCRKVKPGPGDGDQVPYLDSDATCPRDQPTCDSGEFTNKEVSDRMAFLS